MVKMRIKNMKNVKRNGFTLAEMLVTIGIIRFISVVMLSV